MILLSSSRFICLFKLSCFAQNKQKLDIIEKGSDIVDQEFDIHQIDGNLDTATHGMYYNNTIWNTSNGEVGSLLSTAGATLSPASDATQILRANLNTIFGEFIMDAPSSALSDGGNFGDYTKGIAIYADTINNTAIFSFDPWDSNNSSMVVYFHNDNSTGQDSVILSLNRRAFHTISNNFDNKSLNS